jgi:hypothetical protein
LAQPFGPRHHAKLHRSCQSMSGWTA